MPPPQKKPIGKTLAALEASRNGYEQIKAEFGGELPQSILVHNKSKKALDIMAVERSYDSTTRFGDIKTESGLSEGTKAFANSSRGCASGALSRFPQNVGRSLLLFYTRKGDTVVDPFAGHNSRMELCWRAGRNYVGQDLCAEFMDANRKIKDMLLNEKSGDLFPQDVSQADITLYEGDSRHMQAESNVGDFTITSPPYWDIEFYGHEDEQLGTGKSYHEFLDGLYQVMRENFRCLKPGAFCVWCINDFRKDGKFYSYHEDTARGLRAAGFYQWDIAITDLGGSMRAAFPNQVIESKILPKRHEYCLVFRKPLFTLPKR